MVFGALTLATSAGLLGTTSMLLATSAIQLQDQSQKTTEENKSTHGNGANGDAVKTEKCHLLARASPRMSSLRAEQVENMILVLKNNRLFLHSQNLTPDLHPFTGYFLPFPNKNYDGLVTTINPERMLNWVYVDRENYHVRHGVRAEAEQQFTGPFDLRVQDGEIRLRFDGWEGFLAVEETDGLFAVYFDKDDTGLEGKTGDKAVIEIELIRVGLEGITGTGLSTAET